MTPLLLAYAAGVLTIVTPCIFPILPFLLARANRSFVRSVLPMLVALALGFAAVASLAAVAGGWAADANRLVRGVVLALMVVFGLALIFPGLAARAAAPFVALGGRLSERGLKTKLGVLSSALLGLGTGLVWSPCAGPVLGLILAGAALNGPGTRTALLLLAYGLGAATSLAVGILAGKAILARARPSLVWAEGARRGLGALVVVTALAIGAGVDTGLLARLSAAPTAATEKALLDVASRAQPWDVAHAAPAPAPRPHGPLTALDGGGQWLNTQPLDASALRGKVVLVNFWTYSCINCLRTLPYLEAWAEKYRAQGLVVIGVHAPEFAFERDPANVRRAASMLGVRYPVVIDNEFRIWRAFHNSGWPAFYFVGADGRVRVDSLGEGDYAAAERVLQKLLAETGASPTSPALADPAGQGAMAAADPAHLLSPETYVGYEKAAGFVSPGGFAPDLAHHYRPRATLARNAWSLDGSWTVGREFATLNAPEGRLRYRFHARDLHFVAAAAQGRPVRFRVTIDGAGPGASHGADTDADGYGLIREPRLYQLVRQAGAVGDRTFEIEFLDPGVRAYSFTFG